MHHKMVFFIQKNLQLLLLLITLITFLKTLVFPNTVDVLILFLLVVSLLGVMR
jgi:hypothetical protein